MVPENITWAFASEQHRQLIRDHAALNGTPLPKETYYKDTNGKWVRVTAVFDCIDTARKTYRYTDIKYLGAVDVTTKTEVEFGTIYPLPEPKPVTVEKAIKKKKLKKLSTTGTITNMGNFYQELYDKTNLKSPWSEYTSNRYLGDD